MFSTLSSPAEQKNVDDILKQLEAVTLSGDDTWQPKDHDAGMAKLHALLTGLFPMPTHLPLLLHYKGVYLLLL